MTMGLERLEAEHKIWYIKLMKWQEGWKAHTWERERETGLVNWKQNKRKEQRLRIQITPGFLAWATGWI